MNRIIATILAVALTWSSLVCAAKKPLLMPNKSNLYQRILTLPGARLHSSLYSKQENAVSLPPFSVYYVYKRVKVSDRNEWLQVGIDRIGRLAGWITANKTLAWSQGLTLTFRKPLENDRVLLFKDKDSIASIAENYNLPKYQGYYRAASRGEKLKDSPVVAIQPALDIDFRKNFYLLPIHDFEEIYLKNSTARLLQVSSIPLAAANTEAVSAAVDNSSKYTAGIVFVIDATFSMQRYVERTRQAVQKVYDSLTKASLLGRVHFGLIAYQDNPRAAPGIDYLTRRYVSLEQGHDARTFIRKVRELKASQISTKDFIEDSYSGIKRALQEDGWSNHSARYIVLITDAGPRDADDPLASSGFDAQSLNKLAQEKNVAIFVLHLLTPSTMANHEEAARKYRQLSDYPGIGSLYYSVSAGDVREFGEVLESLSGQITSQVGQASGGEVAANNFSTSNPQLASLQAKVHRLGNALQLNYLQDTQNSTAPDVFKAWLLDKNFRDPTRTAIDVRVLLSRNELSDLYDILKQVLDIAEQGLISPSNFLNELKSLAVTVARDPKRLGTATATTAGKGNSLAEMGFMSEFIEDLPYTGEIMNLSLQDWQSWSANQQANFLRGLEDKLNYYRGIHDHTDLWVSLDGGAIDGDSVYPVPLSMLP